MSDSCAICRAKVPLHTADCPARQQPAPAQSTIEREVRQKHKYMGAFCTGCDWVCVLRLGTKVFNVPYKRWVEEHEKHVKDVIAKEITFQPTPPEAQLSAGLAAEREAELMLQLDCVFKLLPPESRTDVAGAIRDYVVAAVEAERRRKPEVVSGERRGPYAQILGGTTALGYCEWSLVEYARRLKFYIEQESAKLNSDTGLIKVLCEAAKVGWELCEQAKKADSARRAVVGLASDMSAAALESGASWEKREAVSEAGLSKERTAKWAKDKPEWWNRLHELWTRSVGQAEYSKVDWQDFELVVEKMQARPSAAEAERALDKRKLVAIREEIHTLNG